MWPVVLIVAGVLLFAANFGWLRWDMLWGIAYLWPLALVAVGLDVLLRGRYRLLIVVGTLVAGVLLYTGTSGSLGLGPAAPAPEQIVQGFDGARRAEVRISTGVTRLVLNSDPGADLLVEGTVVPVRGERIESSFSVDRDTARFRLESAGRITPLGGSRPGEWDLTLSGRAPLALDVDTGVGEALLDLSGLELERLELDTGVGASTVTFPASGSFVASIDTGVGSATIRLAQGVEARIVVSRGIGAVSVPGDFERIGDVYTSPGYGSASERVDLSIQSGVGAVEVVRFR